MRLLAFESSTKLGSVALIEDGVCTHIRQSQTQKSHSEVLHQFVQEILEESKTTLDVIDAFASGCGPGSFTGIRVSLNSAKGFAYALQKPLITVDSLQVLAFANQDLQTKVSSQKILCLINAYKNMSYFGSYDKTKVLKEPGVIQMKNIESLLDVPQLVAGDGYLTYERFLPEKILSKMIRPPGIQDEPSAKDVGLLAFEQFRQGLTLDWKSVKPLYIRSSEAEENKRGIVWSPLDFKE